MIVACCIDETHAIDDLCAQEALEGKKGEDS